MIKFAVKKWFFDQPRVRALLEPAVADYLEHIGSWVSITAQRSMRYRKYGSASAPGQPPSAHRPRPFLRQHIYYRIDPQTRTVVVGAQVFQTVEGWNVPFVQEHGFSGTRRLRNWRWQSGIKGRARRHAWPPPAYAVGDFAVIRATTIMVDSPTGRGEIATSGFPLNAQGLPANTICLRTPRQAARATMLRPQVYGPMIQTRRVNYPARPYLSAAWYRAVERGLPAKFARQALQRFGLRRSA